MNLFKPKYLALGATILYAIYYIPLGELVNINGGLGWDGKSYAAIARNLAVGGGASGLVPEFRFLPSAIVHYLLLLVGSAFTNSNIRLGFQLYDAILLLATVFIFFQVLEDVGYSVKSQTFAGVCLILNFCFLKWSFWYPILTDQSAIFLSTLLLYFYTKGNTFWLLITAFIGYLTNPALFLVGAILLTIPRKSTKVEPIRIQAIVGIWFLLFLLFVLLFVWFYSFNNNSGIVLKNTKYSALAVMLFGSIGLALSARNKHVFSRAVLLSNLQWDRLLFCVAFYFLFTGIGTSTRGSNIPGQTISSIIGLLGINLNYPFVTLVACFAFYGPVVALMVFYWGRISRSSYRIGVGFHLVLVFGLILLLLVRPRQFMAVYPFFVLAITEAFSRFEWKWGNVLGFAVASLLLARFWEPLNRIGREGVRRGFYMNYQVMTPDQYALLVVIFLVVVLFAWFSLWRSAAGEALTARERRANG